MFIVKTTTGDEVRIDYDELPMIKAAKPDTLIYFRQGAVLKRLIGTVVKDPEAERVATRRPGESKEEVQEKLRGMRSEDIFEVIRTPQLPVKEIKRLT